MRFLRSLSATAALLTAASLAPAQLFAQSCNTLSGNLVKNCSFENPGPPSGANYQFLDALDNWNSTDGKFERWSNGFNGFTSRDGVAHLELDSNVGNTSIWQYLDNTVVGQRYTVTFSAAHRNHNGQFSQLQVLVGGHSDGNVIFTTPQLTSTTPGQYAWVDYSTSFVATDTRTKLVFRGVGPSNTYGDHIDNIGVVSTVPEPSTYALMGAGLLAMGFVARRRRSATQA